MTIIIYSSWKNEHEVLSFRTHYEDKSRHCNSKFIADFKKAVKEAEEAENMSGHYIQSDVNNFQEELKDVDDVNASKKQYNDIKNMANKNNLKRKRTNESTNMKCQKKQKTGKKVIV